MHIYLRAQKTMLLFYIFMDENKKFLFSKNKYCFYFHIHQLGHKYALNLKFFGTRKNQKLLTSQNLYLLKILNALCTHTLHIY